MDPRRKGHGGQTVYRTGTLKDRCEPILLFEQCASDLCTRSRAANQRGEVGRGCRSCDQRHGRREVSSIASREPEGKLRRFLTMRNIPLELHAVPSFSRNCPESLFAYRKLCRAPQAAAHLWRPKLCIFNADRVFGSHRWLVLSTNPPG